jgi:hypothetical protein
MIGCSPFWTINGKGASVKRSAEKPRCSSMRRCWSRQPCLVHDQETFWAMDREALRALTKDLAAVIGQLPSDTTPHYPEPVLKVH